MFTAKEEEFYQWLKERFELTLADASLVAQFLYDIKLERQRLDAVKGVPCCPCGAEIPDGDPYDGYCADCG